MMTRDEILDRVASKLHGNVRSELGLQASRGLVAPCVDAVLELLLPPGSACVAVPEVAHLGPDDTTAAAFRQAASNLERGYLPGGSNLRHAVAVLLTNVANEMTDDPRTLSEIHRGLMRARIDAKAHLVVGAPVDAATNPDEYYIAERDSKGGIRLNRGRGLLVANADHTRRDIEGWRRLAKPGSAYERQYRAALELLDREAKE